MKTSDAFPSKYLGSVDFDKPALATVLRCELQEVGQERESEKKPVVYFNEYERPLILNVTNFRTLAKALGADSDMWPSGQIVIFTSQTSYKGEMVDCVRLRAPNVPQTASAPAVETDRSRVSRFVLDALAEDLEPKAPEIPEWSETEPPF